ncbi:MAG: LysE family translocator [Nakamurella sp.]
MFVLFASFALAAVFLIVLPGPDTAIVLRSIVRGGRAEGAWTAFGVCCGLALWVLAAAAGLSVLLAASRTAYEALKIAGAIYLGWLGIRTLLATRRTHKAAVAGHDADRATGVHPPRATPSPRTRRTRRTGRTPRIRRAGFWPGLTTDLLNPKVGVFFVTFLPQFIPHNAPVTPYTLLLGGLYIVGTAAWFALLVHLSTAVGDWLRRPRTQRWLQRVTGVALLAFAVGLLVE